MIILETTRNSKGKYSPFKLITEGTEAHVANKMLSGLEVMVHTDIPLLDDFIRIFIWERVSKK